jgi:hypothetical protein
LDLDKLADCLDILFVITAKYFNTHKIVINGDMNSSLYRSKPQDKLLKTFIEDTKLFIPGDIGMESTYIHHNGMWRSQIDYVFVCAKVETKSDLHIVEDALNLSCHSALAVTLGITWSSNPKAVMDASGSPPPRLLWDEADPSMMGNVFSELLPSTLLQGPRDRVEITTATDAIIKALIKAGEVTVPRKFAKVHGHKFKASPMVNTLIKEKRSTHRAWVQEGRPVAPHQTFTNRKAANRALRAQRRQEVAEYRQRFYTDIMENVNNANFFKLIRKYNKVNSETVALMVNGKIEYDPEAQLEDWADHFNKLATPSEKQLVDEEYARCVRDSLDTIKWLCDKNMRWEAITEAEVEWAIQKLKNGKAKDETGLCAEHLKFAGFRLVAIVGGVYRDQGSGRRPPKKSGIRDMEKIRDQGGEV